MDGFDKFTERARKVLQFAQEEAVGLGHNYIGAEHLLLGLVREGEGVGARALANLGADPLKVRGAVQVLAARQGDVHQPAGLTEGAKQTIALAVDEANRLSHRHVGTEHLLIGLVRHGEGIAVEALASLDVSLEKTRSQVVQVLNQSTPYRSTPRRSRGGTRMSAQAPEEVHRLFNERFNAGDLDGLMELYEEDAALAPQPGQVVVGKQAARGALEAFLAMRGTLELKPRQVIATGDLALLISDWTLSATGEDGKPTTIGSTTSDVLRKQPDGSWLIVIDSPFGTS